MIAGEDQITGEISINYWELLGSLSYFAEDSKVDELGIDVEEYQFRKQSILNSHRILLNFGQLPLNNAEYTHLFVKIKLSFDDMAVREIMSSWLDTLDFVVDGVAEFRIQPDMFPDAFMSVARMVSLRMNEMNPDIRQIIGNAEMVNLENEFRAMRKVHQLLQQYIDAYQQPKDYISEILQVYHSKLSRDSYYRLRLHYFELSTLLSAQDALVKRWNELFSMNSFENINE